MRKRTFGNGDSASCRPVWLQEFVTPNDIIASRPAWLQASHEGSIDRPLLARLGSTHVLNQSTTSLPKEFRSEISDTSFASTETVHASLQDQPWWDKFMSSVRIAYDKAVAEGAIPPLKLDERREAFAETEKMPQSLRGQNSHSFFTLITLWIISFLLGVLDWLSWRVFLSLVLLYSYSSYTHRKGSRRLFSKVVTAAADVMSLGESPEHDFRSYEADWLNKVLSAFWPQSLSPFLTQKLQSVLQRLINEHLSSHEERAPGQGKLKGKGWTARFESFSLGETSPEIVAVREHIDARRMFLDLEFSFECSGNISLGLDRARSRCFTMLMTDVRMRGVVRLMFGSFLPAPPYFAQLNVSFAGRPDLNFNFKFNIAGIGGAGVGSMVQHIVKTSVLDTMVYPYSIPVYIYEAEVLNKADPDLAERVLDKSAPTGILEVKLVCGTKLLAKDFPTGTSDPFAILQVGRERKWSQIMSRTLDPVWNETFRFEVWHFALEVLHVQLWDHDRWKANDFLGSCEINIRMLDDRRTSNIYKLQLPDDKHIDAGTVTLELEYFPLQEDAHKLINDIVDSPTARSFVTERQKSNPLGKVPSVKSVVSAEVGNIAGIFSVWIESAEDLAESSNVSPYVCVRVIEDVKKVCETMRRDHFKNLAKEKVWQSSVKSHTKSPTWKEEHSFEVDNTMNAVAHIDIRDQSAIGTGSLGEFQVPLRAFLILGKESKVGEIKRYLPHCESHHWNGETIVPTKWNLRESDRASTHLTRACVHATFRLSISTSKHEHSMCSIESEDMDTSVQ